MPNSENIVADLMGKAGIRINGAAPWDIRVTDDRFYDRVLRDQSLGLGESYMDGWWECARIDRMIRRLIDARLDREIKASFRMMAAVTTARLFNRQTKRRSREVAERHYNLGNDLFFSFLDPYKQYSCGFFNGSNRLDDAQRRKMDLICKKTELSPGEKVLDIGSGWGGLAKYMTERFECEVTGVNISDEQIRFAEQDCKGLPARFIQRDYRELDGRYDKIVSVGMFEHVGRKNYRDFMETVHRCLKPNGIFLLHTIGGNESTDKCDPWFDKYIFPNGALPSFRQIGRAAEGLFVVEDWHNFGPDYDRTLMAWHRNFINAWPDLKDRYDERFRRMWEYYLLASAGAFRARSNQLWQIVFTHQGRRQPACRIGAMAHPLDEAKKVV